MLYSRSLLVLYFEYSSVYVSIPNSQSIPLPGRFLLVTISSFSKSVFLTLDCLQHSFIYSFIRGPDTRLDWRFKMFYSKLLLWRSTFKLSDCDKMLLVTCESLRVKQFIKFFVCPAVCSLWLRKGQKKQPMTNCSYF